MSLPPRFAVLRRGALALSTVAGLAVCAAAAQDPGARRELEALRDSLAAVRDSAGLAAAERRWIDVARVRRDSTLLHLRLGLVALRLGELGGAAHFEDAASEFEWAAELEPRWPYPWFGLGLAEARLEGERSPRSFLRGIETMLDRDPLTRAAAALGRSVELDPGFRPGLVALADIALRQRFNRKLPVAVAALRRAAGTAAARDPELLLAWGRVEREGGSLERAAVAFERALAAGAPRGIALLELARTRLALGDPTGAAAYYEGAAAPDPAAVRGYRDDLAPIATPDELAALDSTRGPARAGWLRRYWRRRDLLDLRADGERLREHYRRLLHASRRYRLGLTERRYDVDEPYRSGSRDLDDRGVIYVRHGEPTATATLAGPRLCGNLSWRYARAEGDLVFHFVARDDVEDFRLVESVYDVIGAGDRLRLRDESCRGGPTGDLLVSREAISPIYGRLAGAGRASTARLRQLERRIGQQSIALGTTTDTHERRFARALNALADAYAVGTDGKNPLLHVVFAVAVTPKRRTDADRGRGGPAASPLRLRLVVVDEGGEPVAAVDTTQTPRVAVPLGRDHYLLGRIAVAVPAGSLRYRVSIARGDAGTLLPWGSVEATPVRGGALTLSDLALGVRGLSAAWRPTASDTVLLSPVGIVGAGALELYYEVRGVRDRDPLRVELTVTRRRKDGGLRGRRPAVRLAFTERATGPVLRVRRGLALGRLATGDYWLDVRVQDPLGRVATRGRPFSVRPLARGVPAP